jgi:RHS repeat-associated protein
MSDVDRYQYGYDPNSNRLFKANVVGTPVVSGGLDEYYSYDNLNRLTVMQRGVLNGTSTGISGTPSREMDYTLDPTGNWSAYLTKTNGTTDLNQTRTANKVNEITAIGGTPAWATPPVYDAAGNMTSFPQPASPASNFIATYDAWNRMTSINTSGGSVATYQYDGRGRRIVKNTAATGETRHFYYTSSWQDIEERTGTSTTMDKQYVWGVRYIDELVCRDDATPQRLYAMQDANFNLTSIANASGGVVERYRFDPYGSRTIMNASWGTITASTCNLSIGHQGLIQDVESGLVYNRVRYLSPVTGSFLRRDPSNARYIDGMNLYQYESENPCNYVDPTGLETRKVYPTTQPSPPPSTQPVPGPTVGPVKTATGPGTSFYLFYHGPRPTIYQTIEVQPAPCCTIPNAAVLHETAEHGGNNPTTRPVGDNNTGDPKKPFGGRIITMGGSTTMTDQPNFDDPSYPDGFVGIKKGHITVICQGNIVAEFDFVTTAIARGAGNTVLTPSPTSQPVSPRRRYPTTQPSNQP